MSKLDLQIKSIALADLENIADFIAKDNKKVALELLKVFYNSFDDLCFFPKMGTKRKDLTNKNVRFLQIKQKYVVVYSLEKDTIFILRVLSNYQEICSLL